MAETRAPHEIIAGIAASYDSLPDAAIVERLAALPPLADESDPRWDQETYWHDVAYPYVALGDIAARRRLVPAIRLLLDRASYGDPGEIMRGLRHQLEAIVKPDWSQLANICLDAAGSPRLGTRLWALDQLAVLDDVRARSLFEEAVRDGPADIRDVAEIGLSRLGAA